MFTSSFKKGYTVVPSVQSNLLKEKMAAPNNAFYVLDQAHAGLPNSVLFNTVFDARLITEGDARFVNLTGDTMIGDLLISSASLKVTSGSATAFVLEQLGGQNIFTVNLDAGTTTTEGDVDITGTLKVDTKVDTPQLINSAGTEITVLNENFTIQRDDAGIAVFNFETNKNNAVTWQLQNNGNNFTQKALLANTNWVLGDSTNEQKVKVDMDTVKLALNITANAFVINEDGANFDVRIEGSTDTKLLFIDASTNRVGIGTNLPDTLFHVLGASHLGGDVKLGGDVTISAGKVIKSDSGGLAGTLDLKSGGVGSAVALSGDTVNFTTGWLYADGSVANIGFGLASDANSNSADILITANQIELKSETTGGVYATRINIDENKIGFFSATPVIQQSHVADPSGGATVDAEARTVINSILAQLANLGLQAST